MSDIQIRYTAKHLGKLNQTLAWVAFLLAINFAFDFIVYMVENFSKGS